MKKLLTYISLFIVTFSLFIVTLFAKPIEVPSSQIAVIKASHIEAWQEEVNGELVYHRPVRELDPLPSSF